MSLHPVVDVFRSRAGQLLDRARVEATDEVARLSGRGAGWVDEAGQVLGDVAMTMATRLTDVAEARTTRAADRLAEVVDRWSTGLGDRMVRFGADLTDPRRERDRL